MDKHKTAKGQQNARAIPADEAAKLISEKTGKNVTAKIVVEHFAHLKRESMLSEYRDKRRSQNELFEFEQELLEEERMNITGDAAYGDKPMPQESEAMKAARQRYIQDRAKAQQAEFKKFITENMGLLYQQVVEFTGENIKIKPSAKFIGEEFSGDFISKAFRTYSVDRPGKKSGRALIEYRQRRQNSLDNADGMSSDELAASIARKYGGDALAIEQDIIDFFRDLKRSDMRQMFRDHLREQQDIDRQFAREGDAVMAADSFKLLLDAANADKINIVRVQRLAAAYARKNLPVEMRGEFIDRI